MDTAKDTTMQHVTDAIIAEFKRAAEHPAKAPIIVRAEAMLCVIARIEQLESDLATAEQDSRQKQARIERLEEEECKQAALLDCLNEWKALAKSAEKERDALRTALEKIADWDSAWGPYPETNEAWRAMAIVTAREAVPRRGE